VGGHSVRMSVVGASRESSIEAFDRMPGRANYIPGRSYDLYGHVRWRGVYSGIDVVFRGNLEHLEYDLEIAAGRDPGRIRLAFDGIDTLRVDRNGDLVLSAGAAQIHQPKPFAYQIVAGEKRAVDVAYWIDAAKRVRFRTGDYDHARALVIDPQIVFDQSFGGSGDSMAAGSARDTQGNLYITGATNSTDFGTVNAVQSHLGSAPLLVTGDGGRTWSFPSLAGASGVRAIAAAPSMPAVVYAATTLGVFQSSNWGTTWTAPANSGLVGAATALAVDASSASTVYAATAQGLFVSTDGAASWRASTSGLSSTGILTIAAHPTQAGTVFASAQNPVAVFGSADYGQTWTQFTFAPPNQLTSPVIAIVFGSNGSVIAATYRGILVSSDGGNTWAAGASQGFQTNQALAIAPTNPPTLYLVNTAGILRSTDGGQTFTVTFAGGQSGNVQRTFGPLAVDPGNPSTVYATANVYANGTAPSAQLYRSTDKGQTWSPLSLPYFVNPQTLFVSPADSRVFLGVFTQFNVFVTKWSPDGSRVLYSTYLGGSQQDQPSGIAVDATGSAYITGFTSSPNFPTTSGAFQTRLGSTQDVFAAKLSPDGSQLIYSTLLGSQSAASTGIAVDGTGAAVITGLMQGSFPVTPNAFQSMPVAGCNLAQSPAMRISGDAFVTRIAANGGSLLYSTLLGGSCATNATSIAIDVKGDAWVTGSTESPDFPVTADALQPTFGGGFYDAFLARFNPSGGLDYATYVGGPGYDTLNAIAFDSSGDVFLTGETGGFSQPASAGAIQKQVSASCPEFFIGPSFYYPQGNGVVLKLDPAAHSVQRLTYLGAPLCLLGTSIAVDSSGAAWIGGSLNPNGSAPPTVSPFEIGIGQGFLTKLSADFTQVLFSTYFDPVVGLAVDSSGLAYVAGTSAYNTSTGMQSAYVSMIDPAPPAISLDSVASVVFIGSFPAIAPGEVIRIAGKNMGPAAAVPGVIQSGVLASTVAGVQVTFDGVAVPLLSVSAQEIDLVAPFELAGKSRTSVQVQFNGVLSNRVQVAVTGTALQILGVFNQDYSVNSASNPAAAGSIMALYVSGVGQSSPASQDGRVNAAPLAGFAMPVQVEWIANNPNEPTILPVTFGGAAPGLAAGIFQVNFVAPAQSLMNVNVVTGAAGARFNAFVR
jgi:uncharacterized protein (TIGR03437 family)